MVDEKKLLQSITNGEYTTGNILLDMELEQFINDFPKIVTAEMIFPTVHEMAKDVANRALYEYIYNGKTLIQWINDIQKYQWVPCGERLPEIRQACLVTVKYTGFMGMYGTWVKTGHMEYENDWMGDCVGGEVIAWMPLPDPYKPTESEDNKHD